MKPTLPSSKSLASAASNSKMKRGSKDREKRKSTTSFSENNHSNNDKGSPIKDASTRQYAGICSDSIKVYVEQSSNEQLTEDVCDSLTEDINYKLRHIIHESLTKARLSGRNAINSNDIDDTFSNLSIEKVYGASTNPVWIPFDNQSYLYLDDSELDLIKTAEEESVYTQPGDPIISKKWLPDQNDVGQPLKNYFVTLCESIVDTDPELRRMALQNVSSNPYIGTIIEWFYHFGYFLLSKDITYDSLTLFALDLIETLENSPLGSVNVSEKQLKLLVRLILQRLLKCMTTVDILRPMSWVLATLCRRMPLREMVLQKMIQKIPEVSTSFALPLIIIINCLGIDAVMEIFVPHIDVFMAALANTQESIYIYSILETYNYLCKFDVYEAKVFNSFQEFFGDVLMVFWKPLKVSIQEDKPEIDFINVKKHLIKTRRKLDVRISKTFTPIDDIFEISNYSTRMKLRLEAHNNTWNLTSTKKKHAHVVIGRRTMLLLPVLKMSNRQLTKCSDHSLLSYNL